MRKIIDMSSNKENVTTYEGQKTEYFGEKYDNGGQCYRENKEIETARVVIK